MAYNISFKITESPYNQKHTWRPYCYAIHNHIIFGFNTVKLMYLSMFFLRRGVESWADFGDLNNYENVGPVVQN